ncbi:MAG: ABC transporter permease [Candidatus Caldatribacteriota bacterium]|nr:ABC transporter permease [Candidatus Caldatribacteriota bacterium]
MTNYILKRILAIIPIMFIVGIFVFFIIHLIPGNPAAMMLGPEATPEEIDAFSRTMGLDRPVPIQFIEWISNVVRGDFGTSLFFQGQQVTKVVFEHFKVTLTLTILGVILAIILGIITGVIAAINHNNLLDRIIMVITSAGVSIPNFWLGLMLVLFFSIRLSILPPAGFKPLSAGLGESLRYLILPAITLAFGQTSLIARMTRSNMLEVLRSDYVRTAKAKGLSELMVNYKHALKNVLIPVITIIGLSFANLMGGAVVTEQIFNIPGVGRLLIKSVFTRDYPVIEGIVLYIAAMWVIINLVTDVLYVIIDPRIEY